MDWPQKKAERPVHFQVRSWSRLLQGVRGSAPGSVPAGAPDLHSGGLCVCVCVCRMLLMGRVAPIQGDGSVSQANWGMHFS